VSNPWIGILTVMAALLVMFAALKLMERTRRPHPEVLRKLMHVGTGLLVVSFPWVFRQAWPVIFLAALSLLILTAVKFVPALRDGIGTVLTGVRRASLGELCFPAAVAALILLSRGDKLLFAVPMLIMTLADTLAALIGVAYGRVRFMTSDGFKSAEGSLAFFAIAFLSVHVPLLLCTDAGRAQTLLIALIIGLLSMLIEAIASRGLDNLLIPIGTFAFLRLYLHATPAALVLRLGVTVLLVAFALAWRKRTSMDDSALIACALFCYGAAMLGGAAWLIGPAVLFMAHVWFWPRDGAHRVHTVYAVASIALVALLWLGLQVAFGQGRTRPFLFPYAVAFGVELAVLDLAHGTDTVGRPRVGRLLNAMVIGSALAALQILPAIFPLHRLVASAISMAIAFCCVALAAWLYYAVMPALYGQRGTTTTIYSASFAACLIGSALAVGTQSMLV
jgi:phytol kinase